MAVKLTVPKGWKKGTIGELVVGIRGVTCASEDVLAAPNDSSVMLLRSNNIKDGRINFEEVYHLPPTYVSDAQTARMGDVAVCMSNGSKRLVGKAARISKNDAERKIAVGAFCALFRPTTNADPHFVPYLFDTESYRRELHITLSGSAINNLKNSDIEGIKIPLPPLAEQRKIAEILRTWDEAIETAEAELKAKQERKRGLVQIFINVSVEGVEALMKKGRPKVLLSKLGTLKKGGAILREKLRPQGAAVILYGDIYTKYAEIVTRFVSRVDSSAVVDGVRLNYGDIVFAGSGETAEEIGKCIAYVGNEEAYAGGDVIILSNHGQDARYLGYALNAEDAIRQKMRLGQGSSVMHLYKDDVGSIQIPLPPLAEQRKIAEVLQSEDEAIDALKTKAELLRAQKRGLMQKLLTGEVRVAA